jgi:hypothetical protein
MDEDKQFDCVLHYATVKDSVAVEHLDPSRRSQLAGVLVPMCSISEGAMVFNGKGDSQEGSAVEKNPIPETPGLPTETQISMMLKLSRKLDKPIQATAALYIGDRFIAKTDSLALEEGEITFDTTFDIEAASRSAFQLRLFDGEPDDSGTPLGTTTFTLAQIRNGPTPLTLSDPSYEVVLTTEKLDNTTTIELAE